MRGYDYTTPQKKVHRSRTHFTTKSVTLSTSKSHETIHAARVPLFDPRALVSPELMRKGSVRARRRSSGKKSTPGMKSSPISTNRDLSRRRLWDLTGHAEAFKASKVRVKQSLKKLFNHRKKSKKREAELLDWPHKSGLRSQNQRPATPFRKTRTRGTEFHYENLTAELSDTSALERKLQDGLRIQMIAVPRHETVKDRGGVLPKLHLEAACERRSGVCAGNMETINRGFHC